MPPILLLATIAAGMILDWFVPLGLLALMPTIPRMTVSATLFVLGASIPVAARRAFDSASTNITPDMPTTPPIRSWF